MLHPLVSREQLCATGLPQVVGAVSAVSTSICHDPVLLRNGAAEMVDTIQPFPKSYSEEEEE